MFDLLIDRKFPIQYNKTLENVVSSVRESHDGSRTFIILVKLFKTNLIKHCLHKTLKFRKG